MSKKNIFKFTLDFIMLIAFILMFDKMAISLNDHEIIGFFLLIVLIIHLIINNKWIINITKKLFSKDISFKNKLSYTLNFLLLVSFILIGISSVFISKLLFDVSTDNPKFWKIIHFSAAAYALLFIGIHLGFHCEFIKSMFKKILPFTKKINKTIKIILVSIIFAFGCFSMLTSNFLEYLVLPFSIQEVLSQENNSQNMNANIENMPLNHENSEHSKQNYQKGQHLRDGHGSHYRNNAGEGTKTGNHNNSGFLMIMLIYFSIAFSIATVTRIIELFFKRRVKLIPN